MLEHDRVIRRYTIDALVVKRTLLTVSYEEVGGLVTYLEGRWSCRGGNSKRTAAVGQRTDSSRRVAHSGIERTESRMTSSKRGEQKTANVDIDHLGGPTWVNRRWNRGVPRGIAVPKDGK